MLFREFTARFMDQVAVLKRPTTERTFRTHVHVLNASFGDRNLKDVGFSETQIFFSDLAKTLSPKSVQNLHGTFHNIMNRAQREGLIERIPIPDLPKKGRIEQAWFTPEQIHRIVTEAPTLPQKVFFAILAETGMRIEEIFGLRSEDISHPELSLTIKRNLKTPSAYRSLAISPQLLGLIQTYEYGGQLFYKATEKSKPDSRDRFVSDTLWRRRFQEHLETLKIVPKGKPDSRAPFHALRRSNAALMASLGVPEKIAAVRLGHAMRGLTYGLYAQKEAMELQDHEWVKKMAARIY